MFVVLQAQEILEDRVCALTRDWEQTMVPEPRVPPVFNLTLDDKTLLTAIQQLTFIQLKRKMHVSLVIYTLFF